jgi:hypothetical protein
LDVGAEGGDRMTVRYGYLLDKYFYFLMSFPIAAVVAFGFSHTIEQNLIHPVIPRPAILYAHAAIFTAWDLVIDRRIHRIYLFALPLFIADQTVVTYTYIHHLAYWQRISHAILG